MKNASTGQIKKIIKEFILGGLIIYHNLTLVQKNCPLKKIVNVFGNQLKGAIYAGWQNKKNRQTFSKFLAIFEGPRRQTGTTFSNQF